MSELVGVVALPCVWNGFDKKFFFGKTDGLFLGTGNKCEPQTDYNCFQCSYAGNPGYFVVAVSPMDYGLNTIGVPLIL